MKIVCESCGAKYSIADDRVAGKLFKIRCKKCSEVIVVRGDQQGATAEAGAAPAQSQAAIWHVVVDGEQAGPYAPAQLAEMLTNGTVDWEAYVWTEGFDNWSPMRDVADLVAQITGQSQQQPAATAAAGGSGGFRPQHETLTGQPSMGADPFADDAASGDHGLFGGQAAAPAMFARGAAPPAASAFSGGEDPGVVSSSPSPRLSAERVMTGARNENSVLFSLKNLQALATGSGTPSAPAPASAASGGFAGGEGSGLIDIRALASTTGVGENGDASGHKDELLSIGSQGGAFGTLGSPMLAPGAGDDDGNKKVMIWAIVAAVGMLSIAAVAMVYVLRPQPQTPGVGVGEMGNTPQIMPQALAVAPAPAPAAAPSEGELAAQRAAADQGHESEKSGTPSTSTSTGSSHHHHESATSKTGSEPAAIAEPERKAPAPAKSGPKSIDELLDGALSNSSAPSKPKSGGDSAASNANLPDTPSRESALAAMNGVKPAVQACAKGEGGVATVTVNVAGASGHVTTAQVNGVTGPAGSCIATAVRKAQFPKFRQAVFKLTFPFKL
jgi:predicted Zn finger-like uncharacterized protein